MAYEQDRSYGNPVDYNKTIYVEERGSGAGWIVAILLVGALLAAVFFVARGDNTTIVTDPTLSPAPVTLDDGSALPPADAQPMAPAPVTDDATVPAVPADDGIVPADDGAAPAVPASVD